MTDTKIKKGIDENLLRNYILDILFVCEQQTMMVFLLDLLVLSIDFS